MTDDLAAMGAYDNKMIREVEQLYSNVVKDETEKTLAVAQTEAVTEFDKTRKLGFATMGDLDDQINKKIVKIDTELRNEIVNMRNEWTAFREFMLRAKAQGGVNNGTTDGKPQQPDPRQNPLMGYMYGRT